MKRALYTGFIAAFFSVSPADAGNGAGSGELTVASAPSTAPLDNVLAALSDKQGYSFVFDSTLTKGKSIEEISDAAEPDTALARELRGVDLILKRVNERTFAITPAAPPPIIEFAVATPDDEEPASVILVTGTRLPNPNATANSPVLIVDKNEFAQSGYITAEHHLNTLPHFISYFSSQSNNPSRNGRAFVNLRGLGSHRNLILIDGRRPVAATPAGDVDVNIIPVSLLSRAEILTGGATAAYGTDAISGVVNFILDRKFQGLAVDGQYRLTQRGDGDEYALGVKFGAPFSGGIGNALLAVEHFDRAGIAASARKFSAGAGNASSYLPEGAWIAGVNPPSQAAVDAVLGASGYPVSGGFSNWSFNPDGSPFGTGSPDDPAINVLGYSGATDHVAYGFPEVFSYNFLRHNNLVLPLERTNFFSNVDLDLRPWLKPYASFLFTRYNTERQLAPTPAPGAVNPFASTPAAVFSVPVSNPFIHPNLAILLNSRNDPDADFLITKRMSFLGNRRGEDRHKIWQTVIGAKGEITDSWGFDAYFSYGRSTLSERQSGSVIIRNVQTLLDQSDGGASICEGGFDPFGLSSPSEECKRFIGASTENFTVFKQAAAEVSATGDLANLPAGALRAMIGASFRSADFAFSPDPAFSEDIITGLNNPQALAGAQHWTDVFVEFGAPILGDRQFAKSLALTAGWRFSSNSRTGGAHSWTATGSWEIDDRLRLRGGYQRALRTPSILELFQPDGEYFPIFTGNDPCNTSQGGESFLNAFRGGPEGAQVTNLCAAQSSVAGLDHFNQPASQIHVITSSNPNLERELSDAWTGGLLLKQGGRDAESATMSVSLDYWNIRLENAISSPRPIEIVHHCFNLGGANPTFDPDNAWCRMFERDALTGGVVNLRQTPQNHASFDYAGLDLSLNWGIDLDRVFQFSGGDPGALEFSFTGTWLLRAKERSSPFSHTTDRAGTIGETTGSAFPEFAATFAATYVKDGLLAQAKTRYIDSMRHFLPDSSGVGATWYLDLSGGYALSGSTRVRAGVNNLLDQGPRLYSPHVQSGTDPSTFDVLGRRFFFGINVQL